MMNTIYIHFNDIVLKNVEKASWKDSRVLSLLLDSIFNNPFFKITYYWSTGNKKISITQNQIQNKIVNEGEYSIALYSKEKIEEEHITLYFSEFEEDRLRFYLILKYKDDIDLDKITDYLWSIIHKFKDIAYFGSSVYASFEGKLDFPRIRPIKFYSFLSEFAFINIFDKEYFKNFTYGYEIPKKGMTTFFKKIEDDKSLNVTNDDRFVSVKWVNSMKIEDLEEGISIREDFINTHLELPLSQGFNEFGDMELFHITQFEKLSDTEYFSYYDEESSIGFKLVVLDENLQISKEDAEEIKNYTRFRKLKDGRDLDRIVPVLPDRKYIENLNEQSKELGIYKNLYIDDELNLWDVDPVGNWKN